MNPFETTTTVAFELSNLCQLAWCHTKCPLHLTVESPFVVKDPHILPTPLIRAALDVLARCGYTGEINFHQYNEPLIDPRLCDLVRTARERLPQSRIELVTNGLYLTTDLAWDLAAAGVTRLLVTPYMGSARAHALADEIERTAGLDVFILDYPLPGLLDDRLQIYDRPPQPLPQPCFEPLVHVNVTCAGDVALCCQDWKRTVTFGNLADAPLDEILGGEMAQAVYARLSRGDRFLNVCQRCDTGRGI